MYSVPALEPNDRKVGNQLADFVYIIVCKCAHLYSVIADICHCFQKYRGTGDFFKQIVVINVAMERNASPKSAS